jgi:cell division cycle 14
VYEPFFADFGPLNMSCAYRFCQRALAALEARGPAARRRTRAAAHLWRARSRWHSDRPLCPRRRALLVQEGSQSRPARRVYFCTTQDPHRKTNAAVLVGALAVMHLGRTADEAYRPLLPLKPFAPFRDASCGPSTYHLTVLDCLRGLQRARDSRLLDFRSPPRPGPAGDPAAFDADTYEHYERVENGDLNWAVPGKIIAFSGPHARRAAWSGYHSLTPEDYWDTFRSFGVSAIVRLNKRLYDRRRFTEGGFRHHELFFPDGSCPTPAIVDRFCGLVEAEPGVVAVHCKAGLGRTGVLIGLYIMKHYGFTANETLGYLRITRPGSIIGPQQHFLRDWERRMWAAGDAFRAGAGPRMARMSAPRISHGGGGAYDDGDISDEDADVGDPDEEAYDDGGYTCGAPQQPQPPQMQPATPASGGGAPRLPPAASRGGGSGAPLPAALRTSPTKPMHSGTRPSVVPSGHASLMSTMPAQGSAMGGGSRDSHARSVAPSRSNSLMQPRAAGGGSTSGDEGSSLRRGNSLRTGSGYGSEGGAGFSYALVTPTTGSAAAARAAARAASSAASGSSALRSSYGGTAAAAAAAQVRASSSVAADAYSGGGGGMAERLGALRRSLVPGAATQGHASGRSSGGSALRTSADFGRSASPPSRSGSGVSEDGGAANAALLRTISALSVGGGTAPGTSQPVGVARIVTASGQPRKLPAAALAAGAYANAYHSPASSFSGGAGAVAGGGAGTPQERADAAAGGTPTSRAPYSSPGSSPPRRVPGMA